MTVDPAGSGTPMSDRMQSLLSRAAEDQLAEQRQLAGALTELRGQLQQIAAGVASLREGSGGAGAAPAEAALASLSADIREAVRLLAERLDGVARLVQQRGSDLVELNAATAALQAAVRGHGEALAGIGSGLSALPSFGERIGGLQDNLGALHERLAGVGELNATIGALQQRVDAVDHGLRELRSAFAAIGARMAELPGRADLDAAATRSGAPLASLAERLEAIEQLLSGLPGAVTEAAAAAAPAESGAGQVDTEALDSRLQEMANTHREMTAATRDRLAGVEQQLEQVLAALTPDEEAMALDEQDVEDPILAELAELRDALVGEGGISERLEAASDDDLDAKVAEAVERAVGASEERLSAHIDEAILALADALLRRRPGRSSRPAAMPPAVAAPAVTSPAAPVAAPDEADDAEADDETEDYDDAEAPEDEADETSDGSADTADDAPRWQTPPGASGEPAAAQPSGGEDGNRRRRPWWRPGD